MIQYLIASILFALACGIGFFWFVSLGRIIWRIIYRSYYHVGADFDSHEAEEAIGTRDDEYPDRHLSDVHDHDDAGHAVFDERAGRLRISQSVGRLGNSQSVEFAVFAPRDTEHVRRFVFYVWAYLPDQRDDVDALARDSGHRGMAVPEPSVPTGRGMTLNVCVESEHLAIEEPNGTIQWDGAPTNAPFIVEGPKCGRWDIWREWKGRTMITYRGILVAEIAFDVSVISHWQIAYEDVSDTAFYPRTAFASYAHEHKKDVLSRVRGLKKIAPDLDIFIDVLSLRVGDAWRLKIEQHVANKDIFYLFWSESAAKSKWVKREWRLALREEGRLREGCVWREGRVWREAGTKYIHPVPLTAARVPKELHMSFYGHMSFCGREKLPERRERIVLPERREWGSSKGPLSVRRLKKWLRQRRKKRLPF